MLSRVVQTLPAKPHSIAENVESASSARAAFHTRLIGRHTLLDLHAKLKISLPEGKCSPVLCGQGQGLLVNMGLRPIPLIGERGGGESMPARFQLTQSFSQPRPFFSRHPMIDSKMGVWGRCPHVYDWPLNLSPLPFRPKPAIALFHKKERRVSTALPYFLLWGYGGFSAPAPAEGALECQKCGNYQFRARNRKPILQSANALPFSACRTRRWK